MRSILIAVLACLSAAAQTPIVTGGTPTVSGGTPVIGGGGGVSLSMPVITGTGIGFYAITGGNRPGTSAAASLAGVSNDVYCRAFYQPFTRTITTGVFWVATGASANADIGLYNMQGQLIADIGPILVTTSSSAYSHALNQGSVTIQGGQWYWQCQICTSSTVTTASYAAGTGVPSVANASGTIVEGWWAPGGSTGVLPATMGTLNATTTQSLAVTYWY